MTKTFPDIPCTRCGDEYTPTRDQYYNASRGRVALCPPCSRKAKGAKPKLRCCAEDCGKWFKPASNTRKRHDEGLPVYCSRPCAARYQYRKKEPRMQLNKSDGCARPVAKLKHHVAPWIPYSGVGGTDFPALHNPF